MRHFSGAYGWAKHLAFKGRAVWQHHGAADWIGEDLCRSTIPEQRIRIPGVDVRSRFASRDLFAKAVNSGKIVSAVAVVADHTWRGKHIVGSTEDAVGSGIRRSHAANDGARI